MSWDGSGFVPTAGADDLAWRDDLAAARAAVEDDLTEFARAGVYDPALDRYGGSQMALPGHFPLNSPERQQLKDYILSRYPAFANFTDDQINELLDGIEVRGCGYTALANDIVTHYYFRPEEFEREFGFPLFREEGGRQVPNFELLVSDLFCDYHQTMINEGNPNVLSTGGDLNIPYNYSGMNPGLNDGLSDGIGPGRDDGFFSDYMSRRSNGAVQISFSEPQPFVGPPTNYNNGTFLGNDTTLVYTPDQTQYAPLPGSPQSPPAPGAHIVVVTGIAADASGNDCFLVSSWGNEYLINPVNGAVPTIDGEPVRIGNAPVIYGSSLVTIHWDE
jgi:hypothetical protein